VLHTSSELNEGSDYVLTLKDQPILKAFDEENNEEDELENIHLTEKHKTQKNNELKTQKLGHKGAYDVHDDGNVMLPQYEEEKEKDGMRLPVIDEAKGKAKRQAAIRAKLAKKLMIVIVIVMIQKQRRKRK